ncbi:MAG: Carboxyl-terminal protease [Parcubacteria group bacterium GW2011_GWA2_43_13]|nr:MAG: Carboxyl-terminal protease [Parcubacteria group bacterium GW2011_GWA2_43_13]OGY69725.1 MAG: hypothetical protein A3B94_00350 [Candidatus Jacksonbacteria bacterium RIFCSPHIGHO2_02_FULL_43_10]OGY71456.1 MAG: hypothetical protein A2986_03880 [Candidatus Jacksonbacteria bacterium RIFCSPLOWO2_01_FULL_44_13]HAZ16650.1 S41 family peptidase [Candidatus Jacksonbacteria bacterium]
MNFNTSFSWKRIITTSVVLVTLFLFGFVVGRDSVSTLSAETGNQSRLLKGLFGPADESVVSDLDFQTFWDVWKRIKSTYVNTDVPNEKLFYGAISGLVQSLNDPYSEFLDPKTTQEFQDELDGVFEGVGMEISVKDKKLTIVAPLPNTPAMKAGLRSGDIIVLINAEDVSLLTLDGAVKKIRGPRGTTVTLTIYSKGDGEPREVIVTRDIIQVPSISWKQRDDGIIHLQLFQFNEKTMPEIKAMLKEINKESVQGIILDVRNNPGGYLETAVEVSSLWIDNSSIVSEKYRNGTSEEHPATGRTYFKGIPTVVLINEGSASASEIVAGALQDSAVAKIIGKKSFGKGSVQEYETLPDLSSLKLTVAKWYTPKGRSINEEGITPDIEIDMTREDADTQKDPQLDKAIEILSQ